MGVGVKVEVKVKAPIHYCTHVPVVTIQLPAIGINMIRLSFARVARSPRLKHSLPDVRCLTTLYLLRKLYVGRRLRVGEVKRT